MFVGDHEDLDIHDNDEIIPFSSYTQSILSAEAVAPPPADHADYIKVQQHPKVGATF